MYIFVYICIIFVRVRLCECFSVLFFVAVVVAVVLVVVDDLRVVLELAFLTLKECQLDEVKSVDVRPNWMNSIQMEVS